MESYPAAAVTQRTSLIFSQKCVIVILSSCGVLEVNIVYDVVHTMLFFLYSEMKNMSLYIEQNCVQYCYLFHYDYNEVPLSVPL